MILFLYKDIDKKTKEFMDKHNIIKREYYLKLSKMTEEERLQYFRDKYVIEKNLNFEKEINGTVYKVNTYFNDNSQESILQKIIRMIKKS